MWKILRKYAPTSRAAASMAEYTKDLRVIADEFNQYFTSVGQKTAETVLNLAREYNINMISTIAPSIIAASEQFEFKSITQLDLETCIGKMPANKSPGADKIPIKVFQDCLSNISSPLTDIINQSFQTSVFPEDWKYAVVVPHLKEGDHEVASNNRPISLLQSASKICETIALDQLVNYLDANDLLTNHQSGNKKYHYTETLKYPCH